MKRNLQLPDFAMKSYKCTKYPKCLFLADPPQHLYKTWQCHYFILQISNSAQKLWCMKMQRDFSPPYGFVALYVYTFTLLSSLNGHIRLDGFVCLFVLFFGGGGKVQESDLWTKSGPYGAKS